jgi:hypothetical protein
VGVEAAVVAECWWGGQGEGERALTGTQVWDADDGMQQGGQLYDRQQTAKQRAQDHALCSWAGRASRPLRSVAHPARRNRS